jgi:hypothetical protein
MNGPSQEQLPPQSQLGAPEDDGEEFALGAGLNLADPNSPLARFYLRGSHVAGAIGLALLFVWFTHLPVWHTDVWAHLRFGEYIVTQGKLPDHEMFSGEFADQQSRYINYQWVAQAGAYWLFDLGRRLAAPDEDARLGAGALMLGTAHGAILCLRFILLLAAFYRLTRSFGWALVGMALVFGTSVFNHLWILRPQIIGELGFAALLLALSQPVLSRRALVLVPAVFVLWANCHGSFPIGFILLGVALAGQVLEVASRQWTQARSASEEKTFPSLALRACVETFRALVADQQAKRLLGVTVLSLVAVAALNPHGPMLFVHSYRLQSNPNIPTMEEWKPVPVKSLSGYTFLATLAILVPLLRKSPTRFTATQVLLLLVFGLQSMAHARILVWWSMVFPWVVLPHLQACCARAFPNLLREVSPPNLRWTVCAVVGVPLILLYSGPLLWLVFGNPPVAAWRVTSETPFQVSRDLKKVYDADHEGKLGRCVFASETMGDYLLWDLRAEPPVHVFCYTHVHLFAPEHWRKALAVKSGDPGWQQILDDYRVEFVVLEPYRYSRRMGGYSDLIDQIEAAPDRWRVVSEGPVFYARRIHSETLAR